MTHCNVGQYGAALQWPAVPEVLCYVLAVIQIEVGRHSAPFAVAMGSGHCAQARNVLFSSGIDHYREPRTNHPLFLSFLLRSTVTYNDVESSDL